MRAKRRADKPQLVRNAGHGDRKFYVQHEGGAFVGFSTSRQDPTDIEITEAEAKSFGGKVAKIPPWSRGTFRYR